MKKHVDILIKNARVYTMNDRAEVFEHGAIAIRGSNIVEIGAHELLIETYQAKKTLDAKGGVVLPGFVDTHMHAGIPTRSLQKPYGGGKAAPYEPATARLLKSDAAVSLLSRKGASEKGDSLIPFLQMAAMARHLPDTMVYLLAQFSQLISIRSGVTAYVEGGGGSPDSIAAAARDIGIRVGVAHASQDILPSYDKGEFDVVGTYATEKELAETEAVIDRWHGAANGRITAWCMPVTDSTSSDALLVGLNELAQKYNTGLSTHAAAALAQARVSKYALSASSVDRLSQLGLLSERFLGVHFGEMTDDELEKVLSSGACAAHCIGTTNMEGKGFLAEGRLLQMMEHGLTVGLGTDTIAYGDLTAQARAMQRQYREINGDNRWIGSYYAVEMMTRKGAECCLLSDSVGSLEQGKKADIVIIDTDRPEYFGIEPLSAFLRLGDGQDVSTVLIDGQIVMQDRTVTTINGDELMIEMQSALAGLSI